MSSRLFVSLREERALAYDVHAYASNLRDTGSLAIYLGVDPDNALAALAAALEELGRLREGVPPAELSKVREYLKGRMQLSMEDTRAVSSWYGGQALLLDRTRSVEEVVTKIQAVPAEELVRLAAGLITDEALHLAVVGPFEAEEPFREAPPPLRPSGGGQPRGRHASYRRGGAILARESEAHVTTIEQATEPNPYHSAVEQLEAAAAHLHLDEGVLASLRLPRREFTVHFPVEMDDGSVRSFTGYRVQHNDARGPYKGGIRYSPSVSLDEIRGPLHVDDLEVRHRQLALRRG